MFTWKKTRFEIVSILKKMYMAKRWRYTSNFKIRKLKNNKYREIALSKRDSVSINDFFSNWLFLEKK